MAATLGADFPPAVAPPPALPLTLERPGYAAASKPVPVQLPSVTVTDVQPSDILAREGTTVTVHATNLGTAGPLHVRIGELELELIEGRALG